MHIQKLIYMMEHSFKKKNQIDVTLLHLFDFFFQFKKQMISKV